ncbi:MAG: hypothetical protein MI861_22675, partial [Pirellulales bacterium]|nr:hypothetical protein [Pirellulales bacterium]
MNSLSSFQIHWGRVLLSAASRTVVCVFLLACPVIAQQAGDESASAKATAEAAAEAGAEKEAAAEAPGQYTPAIELLPDTVAGLVRVPNLPKFREAFKKTHLGRLMEEPAMQPFIDAQRARADNYFASIDNKIGLRPNDLYDIATGELAVAWLPFEKDKRRPYAVCAIA